jgi:magnesium-transporting ATPase (P-type)
MKYRNSEQTRKFVCLPFDQGLKRKVVIRRLPTNPNVARVYVQGAPETVVSLCKFNYNIQDSANPHSLTRQFKDNLLNNTISDRMASGDSRKKYSGLKVFTMAYRDMSLDELEKVNSKYNEESIEFRNEVEKSLIYLCTFGFEDKIREDTIRTISEIQMSGMKQGSPVKGEAVDASKKVRGVKVRLISGDHVNTAMHVATECGILGESDNLNDAVMTGE